MREQTHDWFKAPTGSCIHYVKLPAQNRRYREARRALCGMKPYNKGGWRLVEDGSMHKACSVCMRKLRAQEEKMKSTKIPKRHEPIGQVDSERLVRAVEQLQSNVDHGDRVRESRGMLKECEDELLRRAAIPQDTGVHKIKVDFVHAVGPVIPLCWIPTDDIAAVVDLLKAHRPSDTLRVAQAQFDATISKLNDYVGEAIRRNDTREATTWVSSDVKK